MTDDARRERRAMNDITAREDHDGASPIDLHRSRRFRLWERLRPGAGWDWLALTLLVQAGSCWTNVVGMSVLLGPFFGALLGIGWQLMVGRLGVLLSRPADREQALRRWITWAALAFVSVSFSYMAVDGFYHRIRTGQARPALERGHLREAAVKLADAVAEARRIADHHLANEIAYRDIRIARAKERMERGAYADPVQGPVALRELLQERATLAAQQRAWAAFRPDFGAALKEKDPADGYTRLMEIHTELSRLWGSLRFDPRNASYRLPPAPAPPALDAAEAESGQADPMWGPLLRLWPPSALQWFMLLLAFCLEISPLLLAWSGADSHASGSGGAGLAARSARDAERPDRERAAEFHRRSTPPYWFWRSVEEWLGTDTQTAPAREEMRGGCVRALHNVSLDQNLAVLFERADLLLAAGERCGAAPEEQLRLLEAVWLRLRDEAALADARHQGDLLCRRVEFAAELGRFLRDRERDLETLAPEALEEHRRKFMEIAGRG
jgi:hypothetical protein